MRAAELASELQLQLPEWSEEWLTRGSYGLAVFAALWILCGLTTFWIRRAYKLQRVESASSPGLEKPAFLKADHEARQAAIERGDAYDEARVAAAEAAAAPEAASGGEDGVQPRLICWLSGLARTGSVVASVVNIAVGIGAAAVLYSTSGPESPALGECWDVLLDRYWAGLAASLFLIVFEIMRWTMKLGSART